MPDQRLNRFLAVLKDTELDFGGDEDLYEGERFVVISCDGDLGNCQTADTLDDVAACIGDLADLAYGFGGWYDLDEEAPQSRPASWHVTVSLGDEQGNAKGSV